MAVFRGLGTLRGAILGSLALGLAPEIFRPLVNYRNLMYGALLLLMMRFQPRGLIGDGSLIWEWLRSIATRRRKAQCAPGGDHDGWQS